MLAQETERAGCTVNFCTDFVIKLCFEEKWNYERFEKKRFERRFSQHKLRFQSPTWLICSFRSLEILFTNIVLCYLARACHAGYDEDDTYDPHGCWLLFELETDGEKIMRFLFPSELIDALINQQSKWWGAGSIYGKSVTFNFLNNKSHKHYIKSLLLVSCFSLPGTTLNYEHFDYYMCVSSILLLQSKQFQENWIFSHFYCQYFDHTFDYTLLMANRALPW